MRLLRPPDLPEALEDRYERVAARLADVELALPPALAPDLARVALASDFVLSVLLRWPDGLLGRLDDRQPLDAAAVAARLKLAGLSEAQAMAALRRTRQVEMARIAWRDLAGAADLDTTLADVSLLAECLIDAALG